MQPRRSAQWAAFRLSPRSIQRFKSILEDDFGTPLPWSDEEIEILAYDVLRTGAAILSMKSRQQQESSITPSVY